MANYNLVPNEGRSPPPFGRDQASVRRIVIDLSTARTNDPIKICGDVFWVVDASQLGELAQATFNEPGQGLDQLPIGKGLKISGIDYSTVFLTNTAQAGKWLEIVYGVLGRKGLQLDDALLDSSVVTVEVGSTLDNAAHVSTVATTITLLSAANTARRFITISSLSTNTANIQIGSAAVGAAAGLILEPGDSITLETTAAVYYYTATAGQTISFLTVAD